MASDNKTNPPAFSEGEIKSHPENYTRESLFQIYGEDPWLHNLALNTWEFATRQIQVESYPVDITLPCMEYCNAKCIQCSFWRTDRRKHYTVGDIEKYEKILKYAVNTGFNPAGETLLHPNLKGMLLKIKQMIDPRCFIYITTNGILLDKHFDTILDHTTSCTISFNAVTEATYEKVMGVSGHHLKHVIKNAKSLLKLRSGRNNKLLVMGSFLVMNQNIHETADFIRLADEIGLDNVYIRSPYNAYKDHSQWAFVNPNYADINPQKNLNFRTYLQETRKAAKETKTTIVDVKFENWVKPMFIKGEDNYQIQPLVYKEVKTCGEKIKDRAEPPPMESNQTLPGCRYPYSILMDCRFSNIMPVCCHLNTIDGYSYVGFDWEKDFRALWNAPVFKELRRLHKHGPLPEACRICTQLDNVKNGAYDNTAF